MKNFMETQRLTTVSAYDYAADALIFMYRKGLKQVHVLDGDEVVGMIYARDLERHSQSVLRDRDVREYMRMVSREEVRRAEAASYAQEGAIRAS